jgi:hypothetical protein
MDQMTKNQKNWLALLGLLEVAQRFGTVRRPGRAEVIPFPTKGPSPKASTNSRVLHDHHPSAGGAGRRNMALVHPYRCVVKREYYRGMCAADTCGQLQQLRQQYEFALRAWGEYQFPVHNEPVGTLEWQSEELRLQLKQKATDARNAANERVLDHKLNCPACRRED